MLILGMVHDLQVAAKQITYVYVKAIYKHASRVKRRCILLDRHKDVHNVSHKKLLTCRN